jgi:integrase
MDAGKPKGSWIVAVNRELGYVRTAMRDGMKTTPKKVTNVPYFPIDAKAERLRAKTGIVTPQQFELLMKHSADHLKPALPLLTYCGLRSKEVKFIRREQIDWPNMAIHLRAGETKEGDPRDIPILDVAVEPLKKWIEHTERNYPECPWLFHHRGNRITSWKTAWNSALRRAGLRVQRKDEHGNPALNGRKEPMWDNLVRFHDTRRTAITAHDDAEVEEVDSERTTGHKTIRVHRSYNQSKKAAQRTREKMNIYLNGPTEPQPEAKEPNSELATQKAAAIAKVASLLEKGLITPEIFAVTVAKL